MKRVGYTYILTNANNTTLYVGVTADLVKRIEEHIDKKFPNSFSAKYNLAKLVWFEGFNHIEEAIVREKQLKGGSRKRKEELINSNNPNWEDLYPKIISGEIEI
ncbi:MAG: GIY-YIG nuclease family protein [Bacteroidota bacterium]